MTDEELLWGSEWDRVADVVVVGSGAAATAAALAAAKAGCSVVILERAEHGGGTTASSGGGMWIPNNFSLRSRGVEEDRDACVRYMAQSAYPAIYRREHPTLGLPADRFEMLGVYFDNASRVIDTIQADGILDFGGYHIPDYYSDSPEFLDQPHMVYPRPPADWKRGGITGGALLADGLREAAEGLGALTFYSSRVVDVITNVDDDVVGVQAQQRGTTVLIGARKGVIFGSGGFLHNERMCLDYLRGPLLGGSGTEGATGDFVDIASRLGARLGNMNHAWWIQVVAESAVRKRATSRDIFQVYGDSMIQVNRIGERALNEKSSYADRGQAHFYWDTGRHDYTNRLLFMIFDEAVRMSDFRSDPGVKGSKLGRYPVPFPEESPSYLISGDTFEKLASRIDERLETLSAELGGVRLDAEFATTLRRTVDQFNDYAEAGHDPQFHRGETALEQEWKISSRHDAADDSMYPFSGTGPYHCVIVGAGALDTKGGPVTDVHSRVVRADGSTIAGLYGAGNCVASPSGQAYWGPGTTVGLGVTFGYLAGEHAAQQPDRDPAVSA